MATITLVGAGAVVTAVNASVIPTVHASTVPGDLVVIQASIRNSGTGDVNLPTGWSNLVYSGHHRIFGRIWQTGDTAPTVTFGAGVANADTIGQALTFRGASAEVLLTLATSIAQLNGSAANIAYPGLAIPKDRHAVLLAAWKQDDASAVSTPATMSVGSTALNIVAGDDAFQSWHYVIQTTAANIAAGTLTMTGGAAAISRVVLLALKPAPSLAAVQQDAYPPRVLVSVTDLTIGDDVAVYRVVAGVRTLVRAGSSDAVTDPSFLVVDAEIPFGVPVSYLAVVEGIEYATGATTYTLTGGKTAVTDAITGLSAEVLILAWPESTYDRNSSTFRVGGRNVAVLGDVVGFNGQIELYVETTSSVDNVAALLANATEGTVQIRQPGGFDGVDSYVAVLGIRRRRWSQDGSDDRRVIVLDALEVEPWVSSLAAATYTYADLEALYTGLTYADLASAYATYLALAQAELT